MTVQKYKTQPHYAKASNEWRGHIRDLAPRLHSFELRRNVATAASCWVESRTPDHLRQCLELLCRATGNIVKIDEGEVR